MLIVIYYSDSVGWHPIPWVGTRFRGLAPTAIRGRPFGAWFQTGTAGMQKIPCGAEVFMLRPTRD